MLELSLIKELNPDCDVPAFTVPTPLHGRKSLSSPTMYPFALSHVDTAIRNAISIQRIPRSKGIETHGEPQSPHLSLDLTHGRSPGPERCIWTNAGPGMEAESARRSEMRVATHPVGTAVPGVSRLQSVAAVYGGLSGEREGRKRNSPGGWPRSSGSSNFSRSSLLARFL